MCLRKINISILWPFEWHITDIGQFFGFLRTSPSNFDEKTNWWDDATIFYHGFPPMKDSSVLISGILSSLRFNYFSIKFPVTLNRQFSDWKYWTIAIVSSCYSGRLCHFFTKSLVKIKGTFPVCLSICPLLLLVILLSRFWQQLPLERIIKCIRVWFSER